MKNTLLKGGQFIMDKKPKTKMEKVTQVVVWIMLIAIIGGAVLTALAALGVL